MYAIHFVQCEDRTERDRLLMFIDKLLHHKQNVKIFLDANGMRVLVDLVTLAHLHTSRAYVPTQTTAIEASPDQHTDSEKEWYFSNKDKQREGPYSFREVCLYAGHYLIQPVLNRLWFI